MCDIVSRLLQVHVYILIFALGLAVRTELAAKEVQIVGTTTHHSPTFSATGHDLPTKFGKLHVQHAT